MLQRSALIKDDLLGDHPVIQPTDYIILKLMAIANNPERASKDEGDILSVMRLQREGLMAQRFESLDTDRMYLFAERFGQRERVVRLENGTAHGSDILEKLEL